MHLTDFFEDEASPARIIHWKPSQADQNAIAAGEETIVWVDVAKVEAAWSTDSNFYVGPQGTVNAIGQRYARFNEWMKDGGIVEMSCVGFDGDRYRPFFTNGRHRFAWMRDHGAIAVPVCTPADRAEEFRAKYGTSLHRTVISAS